MTNDKDSAVLADQTLATAHRDWLLSTTASPIHYKPMALAFIAGWKAALRQLTQSDALRIKLLEDALMAVVGATRAYLPPDGIDAKECLSRILGATDNPSINPIIFEIEGRAALQGQKNVPSPEGDGDQ